MTNVNQKIAFFRSRSNTFHTTNRKLHKRLKYLGFLRVFTFVAFIITAVIAANKSLLLPVILSALFFLLIFVLLVKRYNIIQFRARHFDFLRTINDREIGRLSGKMDGLERGLDYITEDHPYLIDLDIFGQNSLFQFVNRCSTPWGKKTLAGWLSTGAGREEILGRQESIRELSENPDWIQEFQASGMHHEDDADITGFIDWLNSVTTVSHSLFYQIIRFAGPLLLLGLIVAVSISVLSFHWIVLGLVVNGFILIRAYSKVALIHDHTSKAIKYMKGLEVLIVQVENASFKTPMLRQIRSDYATQGQRVSSEIRDLNRTLQHLDNRSNQIYHLFNILFLLDLHFSIAAENWKSRHSDAVGNWFHQIGVIEGLVSFAGMTFANSGFTFPEILNKAHSLKAIDLGHPLIPAGERITNDFSLSGRGSVAVITGSNMAGKSTFLRTVGINMVIAMAGGPVCAGSCSLSLTRVFTSMRTQDNLEEHISSFYAELKRLQLLLSMLDEDDPVFFLLDEILKGTNSHDRHLGAVSLVRQLAEENASGMISTHDLELAHETSDTGQMENYSFNSRIVGEKIHFDYKLSRGICHSLNASQLMKEMGIRIRS